MKNAFYYLQILIIIGLLNCSRVYGQSAIGQLETMSGGKVNRSSSLSSANMNSMVTGAILQSFFSSILSNPGNSQEVLNAQQQAAKLEEQKASELAAEQRKIREAKAQADYDKMMQSYKLLDDAQNLKIKTLSSSDMEFKTLDGDAEPLSAQAREQFEPESAATAPSTTQGATMFFGDVMPPEDLQTLLDLNNNPAIVDLREADRFIEEEAVKDSHGIVKLLRKYESEGDGEPIIPKPDCIKLSEQLKGYLNQREQFKKTIELSKSELMIWETANNDAMLNAAKDGLEYFTGELLQGLTNRGKAADRLQQIYNSKSRQMALDGINVAEIQKKIDRLRAMSSSGQFAEFASSVSDWETLAKDGMSTIIKSLTDSNSEIQGLLKAPEMKEYFETETPELNTLLDISKLAASNMVFGKWVAKKIPVVAVIELSIKQVYNGTDYLLSLNRILEAKKINGGVMDAALYIQKNIDNTYLALTSCQ